MNELALFTGCGGGLLASRLLGWTTVGAVEIEPYQRQVLLQRQRDGMLDRFPIWDDVKTFDGKPWRGKVDVISGGFPCQDISISGEGKGLAGKRSGLWKQYARIIEEVRPTFVFAENSPVLRIRGLGTIIQNLNGLGYDVRWGVLGAGHLGAKHQRDRMWVVAYSNGFRQESWMGTKCSKQAKPATTGFTGWITEPSVGRMADGLAHGVERLAAIGNGQVPIVAATAWHILTSDLFEQPDLLSLSSI